MIIEIGLVVVGFIAGVLVGRVNPTQAAVLAAVAAKAQAGVTSAAKKL